MEFNATLVGVIVLLLIFVPVGYLIATSSGKSKKIKKSFLDLSKIKGLNVEESEVIGNLVIGVDESSKKLAFTTCHKLNEDYKIVDLNAIKDCRAKSVKHSDKTLEWAGLELVEKSGRMEIPFYIDSEESISKDPMVYLQDAKRWENTIRPLLLKAS